MRCSVDIIPLSCYAFPRERKGYYVQSKTFLSVRELCATALGAALMTGIKRGLFSNEAGMGSVPNAAATASASHPVKQGLIQALAFCLILTGMLGFSFYRAVV